MPLHDKTSSSNLQFRLVFVLVSVSKNSHTLVLADIVMQMRHRINLTDKIPLSAWLNNTGFFSKKTDHLLGPIIIVHP